jgi:hypothetical protein
MYPEQTDEEIIEVGFKYFLASQVDEIKAETERYAKQQAKDSRIAELKALLASTDYIVLKIAEGAATKKEYAEKIAQRQAWRTEINDLESEDSIEE